MGTKNKKQPKNDRTEEKQTFKEHLRVFRSTILWIIGSFLVASIIGFEFKDIVQGLITAPLVNLTLIDLADADAVSSLIVISLYVGALLSLPLVFYHVYRFLEPVINGGTAYVVKLFTMSSLLLAAGLTYGYMVTVPHLLGSLVTKHANAAALNFTTDTLINFATANTFALALLFQLPLLAVFINSVQRLSTNQQLWGQRFVILFAAIAGAVTTPTGDIVNFAMTAVPIVVLYQFGAIIVYIKSKKAKPAITAAKQEQRTSTETYSYRKPVLETEDLAPFPESLFDAMIQDKEFENDTAPSLEPVSTDVPLPPSLEVTTDQPGETEASMPVGVQHETGGTSVMSHAQQLPAQKQQLPVVIPTPTSAPVPVAPTYRPVTIPTPRFMTPKPLPQPEPQPVRQQTLYAKPITETIRRQRPQMPTPLAHQKAQPIVPFQMSATRPRQGSVEGLVAA